jgi:excisionase family DNA binding protein
MKPLLDVKGAAEALAVSTWTIRAYIRDGKLQPVRIGRLVRIDEGELERFVNEHARKIEPLTLKKEENGNE